MSVRVGTPPQWVDLFVSTASQETWVVSVNGCDRTQTCIDKRGGVFKTNESSTWKDQGYWYLGLDPLLGFGGRGNYGLDNVALNDKISVPSQLISAINTTEYWLGYFGLGVKPTNITGLGPDRKTFLNSMVENKSLIPSHSYGYTAGASYRLKGVPGSLTLGGFDTNRFHWDHNTSFSLDPDQKPTISINQVTARTSPQSSTNSSLDWTGNAKDLLSPSQANLFTIDSSTPFLWLPEPVCLQFEKALNLSYDDDLDLYTFGNNTEAHDTLVAANLTFDFVLADLPGSSNSVKLTLPYTAFDLTLLYPYPGLKIKEKDPGVNYFPLRKAANNSQYTIGRSFLQEVYLTVDYERNNFSVHQANFVVDPQNMQLVDIRRADNSTWKGPSAMGGANLSKGAMAGIIIAAICGLCLILGLLFLIYKIRRDRPGRGYVKEQEDLSRKPSESKVNFKNWLFHSTSRRSSSVDIGEGQEVPELQGKETGSVSSPHGSELDGSTQTLQNPYGRDQRDLRGYYGRDLHDIKIPYTAVNAIGHDPSMPVELPYRSSNYRTSRKLEAVQELAPSPEDFVSHELPSPDTKHGGLGRRVTKKSSAVSSPSDATNTAHGSDPTHMVSPITPQHEDEEDVSSLETIARRAAWYVSNETPSVSSESRGPSPRSFHGPASIDGRAGFPKKHSRQNTISSLDRTTTPGTPSAQNSFSMRGSPSSYTKVPRNSRATTTLGRAESTTSGDMSDTSTVTNVIRRSVQRGFSWLQPQTDQGAETRTAQPPATISEHSPYSPARWIEFWKTGRDPRLGPMSDTKPSPQA